MTVLEAASDARAMPSVLSELRDRFGRKAFAVQPTADGTPTVWSDVERVRALLEFLKHEVDPRYRMLLDLTAIDERLRRHRAGQPRSDFTIVYHLMSFERTEDIRIKVPLSE
jgi:NADH-quinone oxidoreductase subunit C/D